MSYHFFLSFKTDIFASNAVNRGFFAVLQTKLLFFKFSGKLHQKLRKSDSPKTRLLFKKNILHSSEHFRVPNARKPHFLDDYENSWTLAEV